jgi:hypothetical protein
MNYLPEEFKVVYGSKDGKDEKVFDALEWLGSIDIHSCTKVRAGGEVFRLNTLD